MPFDVVTMKPENPSYSQSNRNVYYRSSQIGSFIFAAVLVILAVLLRLPPLSVPIISCFAILMAYSAIQIRIVVSPEGIEYYQVGYSVRTTWKNLSRIGKIPAGRIMVEGLILYEPALFVDDWLSGVKYIQTRGQVIPLSLFKRDWLNSKLGQDIKKHAPHLFIQK